MEVISRVGPLRDLRVALTKVLLERPLLPSALVSVTVVGAAASSKQQAASRCSPLFIFPPEVIHYSI